jgi:hypothetical protein
MSKPKTRWIVIFAMLATLQLLVLFNASNPVDDAADTIDKADTAWMIVATAFVSIHDARTLVFLWRYGKF